MQPENEAAIGQALHLRMLAGDRVASDEVFLRYHAYLVDNLRAFKHRKDLDSADDEDMFNAVLDALQGYLRAPDRYQPERGKTLAGYLAMSAQGDLLNRFDRRVRQVKLVRFDTEERKEEPSDQGAGADAMSSRLISEETLAAIRSLAETPEEQTVLEAMIEGVRENAICAERLGLSDPSSPATAKQVNKIKDRLAKRIKRRFSERMPHGPAF